MSGELHGLWIHKQNMKMQRCIAAAEDLPDNNYSAIYAKDSKKETN